MKYEQHRNALLRVAAMLVFTMFLAITFNNAFMYFISGFFFAVLLEETLQANRKLKERNDG